MRDARYGPSDSVEDLEITMFAFVTDCPHFSDYPPPACYAIDPLRNTQLIQKQSFWVTGRRKRFLLRPTIKKLYYASSPCAIGFTRIFNQSSTRLPLLTAPYAISCSFANKSIPYVKLAERLRRGATEARLSHSAHHSPRHTRGPDMNRHYTFLKPC